MITATLTIEELVHDDIVALLARNRVGRIAYAVHDRVDIEPIHFVYADGWIYGRTSRGTKLSSLLRNRWVAFEVDEVHSLFDWCSVVVHGAVYFLDPDPTSLTTQRTWERAIELLRRLVPQTLQEGDPVPHRDVVFRIAVQEATGRRGHLA